ncbi:MAG: 3-deoxy-7-phosphoheptulonate synthase [Candidatus Obscuribacterales bacterium]|nr:3-deoxy-7-phosphoheptulonate synthase [Candidatus Obscuribacterales bacterium]
MSEISFKHHGAKSSRSDRAETTAKTRIVEISEGINCGARELLLIAGPCAVEDLEQMEASAAFLSRLGIGALRGCIFKPRTSPYSYQGIGADGIALLERVKRQFEMPVVTEVMSREQIEAVYEVSDVFQIGSRNMQNFELLKEVGLLDKPVILKRGLSATIEEFLMAAEYILSGGNQRVILCERGIRSFDPSTRNVLDLGAVAVLKSMTDLPVLVDPSHALGKSEFVATMAGAAIAAGADGLVVECHPRPAQSVSDARQALSFDEMQGLVDAIAPIAEAVGRSVGQREFQKALHNIAC